MRKKSLFFRFFTALSLLIAIPLVIITTILGYQFMRYSESEISRSYIGKLKVANNFSEMIAKNIYMDALKITMDGFLNEVLGIYAYGEIFESMEGIMKLYSLQESIVNLAKANDVLHSVYLLPDNADYMITSNQGVVKLEEFADKGWMEGYSNFKAYSSGPSWMPTRTVSYDNSDKEAINTSKVITFFYVFTPYTTNVKGTLIFNIHEKKLRDLINSRSSINEGYIIIVNDNGDVISHINEELVAHKLNMAYLQQIQERMDTEGYIINNAGNNRELVTYYKSEFNGWIYIGVFPIAVLTDKVNSLMMRTIYICITLVAIGILASFIISKRISNPLNKLVDDIRINRGIDIKKNDSEMAILSNAFEHMKREEARLFSFLESSRVNNRNVYLMNLLQGKSTQGLDSELTGVDFTHGNFICAVILIDRYNEFTSSYSNEQQEYMKTLILRVSEQLISREFKCEGMIYQRQRIAFIVNYDFYPSGDVDTCLKKIFIKIQAQISKVLDNTISVGIGNSRKTPGGVAESFERAQEALKYKLITGYGSINIWKNIEHSETTYFYPYSKEKHIFNLINSGITDKIESTVSELIREIREQPCMDYENVVQIFIQLMVNTVNFLLDQHLSISMIFGSNYNIYQILSTKETLDDIKIWFVEMFSKITGYFSGEEYLEKGYFGRALAFIHDNYRNDIDINTIADNVGISYSHLRKIFKDETGDNIINYINRIRVDESMRLLCQTNMTIREIALELGYNNEQSFARFFKKYENLSPGEYRVSKKNRTLSG